MIIIYNLEALSINEGDYILLTYDDTQVAPSEIKNIYDTFCTEFEGRNRVIAIPKCLDMTVYRKSEMIKFLRKTLNELEDNND